MFKGGGLFRLRSDLTKEPKFDTPCNHEGRTKEMHSCPFTEEIDNDDEPCCNCCENCEYECMMDI